MYKFIAGLMASAAVVSLIGADIAASQATVGPVVPTSAAASPLTSKVVTVQGCSTCTAAPTTDSNGGAAITSATMPSGGAGFLGWLSAIYTKLGTTLTIAGAGTAGTPSGGVVSVQQVTGTGAQTNATLTTLAAGASVNVGLSLSALPSPYTSINVSVYSPTAGTLHVQYYNGSTGIDEAVVSVSAATPYTASFPVVSATYNVFFVNGSTAQSSNTSIVLTPSIGK